MTTLMDYMRTFTTTEAVNDEWTLALNNSTMSPTHEREAIAWACKVRSAELNTGNDYTSSYPTN